MQIYVISKDTDTDYVLNRDDLLFPCLILDMRNGDLFMYETYDSEENYMVKKADINILNDRTTNLEYNIFQAFGATEYGVLDNNIVGIYK
jgi:hypothetical protein